MKRSKQAQALHDTQDELWDRLRALVPDLLVPDLDETDEEGIFGDLMDDYGDKEVLQMIENNLQIRARWDQESVRDDRYGDLDDIELIDLPGVGDLHHKEAISELIHSLRSAVETRNIEHATAVFSEIDSRADESPYLIDPDAKDQIQETISELEPIVPRPIYRVDRKQVQKPARKLILEVSSALTHRIASNPTLLYQLSPREFEEFIAELFDGFGYQVQLTARTRDGGRDIIAVRSDHGILSKLLIECKRFSPTRPVGLSYVRELYAVKTLERATKAVLATTSYFTRDARHLEKQLIYELELKDFNAVTHWAREYSEFLRRLRHGV